METTTGMSAEPIAATMCMPNNRAMAVMISSGVRPAGWGAFMNQTMSGTQANTASRFSTWRPGSNSGLLPQIPCNLAKAATEPVKVSAPMTTPAQISNSWMTRSKPEV